MMASVYLPVIFVSVCLVAVRSDLCITWDYSDGNFQINCRFNSVEETVSIQNPAQVDIVKCQWNISDCLPINQNYQILPDFDQRSLTVLMSIENITGGAFVGAWTCKSGGDVTHSNVSIPGGIIASTFVDIHGDIITTNGEEQITITCSTCRMPIGKLVELMVDDITSDFIRFTDKKQCFHGAGVCSADKCKCSLNGMQFMYIFDVYKFDNDVNGTSFSCAMHFNDQTFSNGFTIISSIRYVSGGFQNRKTNKHVTSSIENDYITTTDSTPTPTTKDENMNSDTSKGKWYAWIIPGVLVAAFIVLFFCLGLNYHRFKIFKKNETKHGFVRCKRDIDVEEEKHILEGCVKQVDGEPMIPEYEVITTRKITKHTAMDQMNIAQTPIQKDEPGRPFVTKNNSDGLTLKWMDKKGLTAQEQYEIWSKYESGKFILLEHTVKTEIVATSLSPGTTYVFKVRKTMVTDNHKCVRGKWSQTSVPIKIHSPSIYWSKMLQKSEIFSEGPPCIHKLPNKESICEGKSKQKTRKFDFGNYEECSTQRTVLLVGLTGSGKSTMINAMINYIIGVNLDDSFRFIITSHEESKKERKLDQTLSRTEWVTCYTIYSNVAERIDYTINIIDTPGIEHCNGDQENNDHIEQIKEIFDTNEGHGIPLLSAICFVTKAHETRLTTSQTKVFDSIIELFTDDIKDNIIFLTTFSDGSHPSAVAAIKYCLKIPQSDQKRFDFNNSALYADNTVESANQLSSLFWNMGIENLRSFFLHIKSLPTKNSFMCEEKKDQGLERYKRCDN